nr:hypothetical protein CFP56_00241 [Quercus suber]
MTLPNPTLNPPLLPSSRAGHHSRSPSRSPLRPARDFDPTLRNLSPTSTLRLFTSEPYHSGSEHDPSFDLATASDSQRLLGTQAAQLCLNLRSWARELDMWKWSGTFEAPELANIKPHTSGKNPGSIANAANVEDKVEHWGSMPATVVRTYEQRIAEIMEQVDNIEVEELKDYVLLAHQQTDQDPSALPKGDEDNSAAAPDLCRLDDFTAVVTATILQALPYLSKINRLLNVWTVRLTVCKTASTYLSDLKRAQTDLDNGWTAITVSPTPLKSRHSPTFDRTAMNEARGAMETQIRRLGRRLDRFLDELEGQDDAVPESWIDDFETLESAYGSWVVQAERKVLEEELRPIQPALAVQDKPETESDEVGKPPLQPLLIPMVEKPEQTKASSSLNQPRSRHVPIIIDYERDGKLFNPELAESVRNDIDTPISAPVPISETESPPALSVKKRTAFLKAEIERAESLQKQVKSPVRSFEHASNAFTRLFKKDRIGDERLRQISPTSPRTRSLGSRGESENNERGRTISAPVAAAVAELDRNRATAATSPIHRSTNKATSATGRENEGGGFFNRRRGSSAKRRGGPRDYIDLPGGLPTELLPSIPTSPRSSSPKPESGTTQAHAYQSRRPSSPLHDALLGRGVLSKEWPLVAPEGAPQDDGVSKRLAAARTGDTASLPNLLLSASADAAKDMHDPSRPSSKPSSREQVVSNEPSVGDAAPRDVISISPSEHEESLRPAANVIGYDGIDVPRFGSSMTYSDLQISENATKMPTRSPNATLPVSEIQSEPFDVTPGSVDSGSSVEIRHASSVDYFPVQPSPALSRLNSHEDRVEVQQRRQSTSALSPAMLKVVIPGPRRVSADGQHSPLLKRASTTNIETHLRSELKAIDIRLRKSDSALTKLAAFESPLTATASPTFGLAASLGFSPDSSPGELDHTNLDSFPSPPIRLHSGATSPISPVSGPPLSNHLFSNSSPVTDRPTIQSPVSSADEAPLNTAMRKRRQQPTDSQKSVASPSLENAPALRQSAHSNIVPEDSFDRHVSEVLNKLPGTIKFRPRPGAETPLSRMAEQRNLAGRPVPRYGPPHLRSNSIGMTIAPAGTSPKKSSNVADAVKLYHLRAEGREEPIKLFVRLVGEDERCMVRVGGGWQDLAEYLRQYAEHHGSRTVSGSGLEVFSADPNSQRRVSGPPGSRAQTPIPYAVAGSRPGSKEGPSPGVLDTLSRSEYPEEDDDNFTSNPESPLTFSAYHQGTPTSTVGNQRSTPRTVPSATKRDSRPSTADAPRPSSRTSFHDGSAHASPASIKRGADLAEQKAKWLEGMLEKARASAEKSKEDRFVEISRIGATRRVIFRSPSAQGDSAK